MKRYAAMRNIIAGFVLAFSLTGSAIADTTGGLSGMVMDKDTGAPIAGVLVTANSPAMRVVTRSDSHGRYVFLDLIPAEYIVTFSNLGYMPASITAIGVRAGSVARLDVRISRALRTIVRDFFHHYLLMQPGVVSDLYRIRTDDSAAFNVVDSYLPLLFSVPGVQSGTAPRMMH